jgi:serine/threonine protein kinase
MAPDATREGYLQLIEARAEIGGRYLGPKRIGTMGGDGHFSLVFSAIDQTTSRKVAIKVFRPDRLDDPYRFQCFCREAILLQQLAGTPNVLEWVGARDEFIEIVSSSSGISFPLRFPYCAVELALTDVGTIIRAGSWRNEEKMLAFREMCKAVQRIHREGIVHRDVKPSNFLVMENKAVKLSDFGTARYVNGIEPALLATYVAPPGDTRYTSPEMLGLLHDVDPAIAFKGDVFSLGATLFELFSGVMLGLQIFDNAFAQDLAQAMNAVSKVERQRLYMELLPSLDSGHPLPSIYAYAPDLPPAVRDILDSLYKAMASLDFRRRLCDFEVIFLKINQCLLVLRNLEKVRRWQQQKEIIRQNRVAKLARRKAIVLRVNRGGMQ